MKPRARIKQKSRRLVQRLNHIHPTSSSCSSGGLRTHFSEPTYSSSAKQQRSVLSSDMKTPSCRPFTEKPKGRSGARRGQKAGRNRRRERVWKETAEVKGGMCSQEDSEGHKVNQVSEAVGPDISSPSVLPPTSPLPRSQSQCPSPTASVQ